MSEATITVALPYYREDLKYFSRAVDSLLGQTFRDWCGIVLDDSPDGEPKLISAIALGNGKLRYVRNQGPHGIGNAWNSCIEAADTDFVCILHTDDVYEPGYLAHMTELAGRFPEASMYFCGATIINGLGHEVFSLPDFVKELIRPNADPIVVEGENGMGRLMVGNYIMCPTLMYRRASIQSRRFSTSHRFVLDFRFILGAILAGETIVGSASRLYRYRRHGEQATTLLSRDGLRFAEELGLFEEVRRLASDQGWYRAARAARLRLTYRLNAALSGRLRSAVT